MVRLKGGKRKAQEESVRVHARGRQGEKVVPYRIKLSHLPWPDPASHPPLPHHLFSRPLFIILPPCYPLFPYALLSPSLGLNPAILKSGWSDATILPDRWPLCLWPAISSVRPIAPCHASLPPLLLLSLSCLPRSSHLLVSIYLAVGSVALPVLSMMPVWQARGLFV